MTTVQTFEDILAAMRENPVLREAMRQHVRDEEFNDRRYLDIRNAELVYSLSNPENPYLSNLLYEATEAHVISDEQANDLEDTDLILLGRNPDGEPIYNVAEVSITVDDSDVDRAARRSRTLQTASGVATQAAVIGTAISDANRQCADGKEVTYIAMAE